MFLFLTSVEECDTFGISRLLLSSMPKRQMGSVSVNDTDINTFVFIPVSLSISQEKLLMLYRYRTLCRLLSPLLPSHQDLKVFHRALWVSLVAQLVKNPPTIQETRVRFLGWEDPLGKKKAGHSSILAWRTPWTVDCQAPLSMESQESDTT